MKPITPVARAWDALNSLVKPTKPNIITNIAEDGSQRGVIREIPDIPELDHLVRDDASWTYYTHFARRFEEVVGA